MTSQQKVQRHRRHNVLVKIQLKDIPDLKELTTAIDEIQTFFGFEHRMPGIIMSLLSWKHDFKSGVSPYPFIILGGRIDPQHSRLVLGSVHPNPGIFRDQKFKTIIDFDLIHSESSPGLDLDKIQHLFGYGGIEDV